MSYERASERNLHDLLSELKAHHSRLLSGIDEIAKLTSDLYPDVGRLAISRVRLSRASMDRSNFINEVVYPALISRADAKLQAALSSLSADFLQKRSASSRHVTKWTAEAIVADWPGYKADSDQIRQMMRERIEREAALLYPALSRC